MPATGIDLESEHEFLTENDTIKNEHGAYLYASKCGHDQLLMDFFLKDYKDWLVENGIVKLI